TLRAEGRGVNRATARLGLGIPLVGEIVYFRAPRVPRAASAVSAGEPAEVALSCGSFGEVAFACGPFREVALSCDFCPENRTDLPPRGSARAENARHCHLEAVPDDAVSRGGTPVRSFWRGGTF